MEEQNYYSVIYTRILRDERLKDKAKLLYADISSLTKSNGYCYASNEYLSKLYGVTKETISRLLKSLETCGHIKLEYERKDKKVIKRVIYLDKDIISFYESYQGYLLSSKWKHKRRLKAKEQKNICEICGKEVLKGFHIHHKHYKTFKNEKMEDLMFLCKQCHEKTHNKENGL